MIKSKKPLYTADYLLDPIYPINIDIIGIGGTGSFIAPELASLSNTLIELGHKGFNLRLFDNDIVEPHNIGRQKFYHTDIGLNKAVVLSTRINRAYNTTTTAINERWSKEADNGHIIISCVDNIKTRKEIDTKLKKEASEGVNRFKTFYWIDLGNGKDYGQIILKSYVNGQKELTKSFTELFPRVRDVKDEPSCSVHISLSKQSFMINKILGAYCVQLLSSMFIDYTIPYTQLYLNLQTMKTSIK